MPDEGTKAVSSDTAFSRFRGGANAWPASAHVGIIPMAENRRGAEYF